MGVFDESRNRNPLEFDLGETTGAIGDLITVLPVVVAVAALTELTLSRLLLGFGAFQVVWGLYYGLPVSVEPMKALAALVIAGALTASELAVAGLLAGAVLLVVGRTGTLDRVERYVSRPVIRGVQLGVGLILLETGVRLSLDGIGLALLSAGIALPVVLAGYRKASALVVLCVGVGYAVTQVGVPAPQFPAVAVGVPTPSAASVAALEGAAAQLAMTVGNAAVATSVLLSEYYGADVSADELATSMGVMNLIAVPLGALPMCHGSGGVAGKYAFGARTGGSNLILGAIYAGAAALGVGIVAAFPLPMLGVVLGLIAVELGRAGLDTDHLPLTVGVGVAALVTNVGIAFVAGAGASLVIGRTS